MATVALLESFQKTLDGSVGELAMLQVIVAAPPVSVVTPTGVMDRMLATAVLEIILLLTVYSQV